MLIAELLFLRVRRVQRGLHHRFDFGAGVSASGGGQPIKLKFRGIPLPAGQLDRKNLLAFRLVRQVDEKQFVEPPFADQLRRKHADVVAGRRHKDRGLAILHPRQK